MSTQNPSAAAAPQQPLAITDAPESAQALEVGGPSVRLDELGPIVVNSDGVRRCVR